MIFTSEHKFNTIYKYHSFIIISLLVLFLVGCGDEADFVGLDEEIAFSEIEINEVEVTKDDFVTTVQGELNLEYPPLILAETTDSVNVRINKLDVGVAPSPVFIEVSTQPVDIINAGFNLTQTHTVNIYLADPIRVELTSQSFEIQSVGGSTKSVNLDNSGQETIWIWGIKAPEQAGVHKLFLEVFLDDSTDPSWVRDISVTVVDRMPATPASGSGTPTSTGNSSGFGSLGVMLVILILAGGGAFAYFKLKNLKGNQTNQGGEPPIVDAERSTADILNTNYIADLSNKLEEALNTAELKEICFELGVAYDDFEGGFTTRLQAILGYFIRRGRLHDLIGHLATHRPDIELPTHRLAMVLENEFGKSDLKKICSDLDITTDNEDDTAQLIESIMKNMSKDNRLQELVDYLTDNHPMVDLLK